MSLPLAFGGRAVGRPRPQADGRGPRIGVGGDDRAQRISSSSPSWAGSKAARSEIGQALSVFNTLVPQEIAAPYHRGT